MHARVRELVAAVAAIGSRARVRAEYQGAENGETRSDDGDGGFDHGDGAGDHLFVVVGVDCSDNWVYRGLVVGRGLEEQMEGRHTASDDYKTTQEEDRDNTPLLFLWHLESHNLRNGEAYDWLNCVKWSD